MNSNSGKMLLWHMSPPSSWSANFLNKVTVIYPNNSSFNLLACHVASSMNLDSVTWWNSFVPRILYLDSISFFTSFLFCLFFFFFLLFRAAPTAYGSSQARSWIRAVAAGLYHSHSNRGIQAASAAHATAHGNTGSPTPPSKARERTYILILIVSAEPWQELPTYGI